MSINVATLAPANLKSKNVATEQYVDNSVANIDVSGDISANNDVFAQKLGYADYAAMVSAAASGQTVINGGYINTGLIQAGAITANKINTSGLIAENISATTISGKTITGSTISGSTISGGTINGATINGGTLVTTTDAGITTKFSSVGSSTVKILSSTSYEMIFPIYGYNYNGNEYKVIRSIDNNYAILSGSSIDSYGYYAVRLSSSNAGNTSCSVTMYSGSSLLGSTTFSGANGFYTAVINGTTFKYYVNSTSGLLGIHNGLLCVDNLSNNGPIKLVVSYSGGTSTNVLSTNFIHINR